MRSAILLLLGFLSLVLSQSETVLRDRKQVQECWDDLDLLLDSVNETWAKKLWDSWGRPTSGILSMQRSWPGSYMECKRFSHTFNNSKAGLVDVLREFRTLRGRFCWIQGSAEMEWEEKMEVRIGVCLPRSCSTPALETRTLNLSTLLEHSCSLTRPIKKFSLDSVHCEVEAPPDDYFIGLLSLLSTLAVLVLLCTFLDWWWSGTRSASSPSVTEVLRLAEDTDPCMQDLPEHQPNRNRRIAEPRLHRIVSYFSALRNLSRLGDQSASKTPHTDCLHGIRTLAMVSVIIAHGCSIFLDHGDSEGNMYNLIQSATSFGYLFMKTGICSVDTFFILSGFLVSFVYFREVEKRQVKMKWVFFYVHRFFRLTPSLLVVSLSYVALMPQLANGPFWTFTDPGWRTFCKTNWWKNLLFIQNITNSYCAGWLWYLACDMQLYVISPFYLILLSSRPKLGILMILLSALFCALLTGFLSFHYDLDPSFPYPRGYNYVDRGALNAKRSTIFNKLYTKPYTRAGPYLAGLMAGFGVYRFKHKDCVPSKSQMFGGWCLAILSCALMISGMATDVMPPILSAIFNATSHSAWGAAIAWVIYACATGNAGIFNGFLSARVWRIPSRLTYCAYLIHPLAIYWFYFSYKTTLIMTKAIMFIDTMGFLLVSYLCALGVSLLVESPVLAIEKALLARSPLKTTAK